jgi:hypothetical protein
LFRIRCLKNDEMTETALQSAAPTEEEEWYRPGKSLQEFHDSIKFIRCVVGGRGSGKTTTVSAEALRHAWHNAGAKILALRKTEASQSDTSIDTFGLTYAAMGGLYKETELSLFRSLDQGKQIRLPSRVAVEEFEKFKQSNPSKTAVKQWLRTEGERLCAKLEFRGLPDITQAQNKLRGYECSMMIFIEADLMQRHDLDLGVACLRWKGADPETCDAKGFIKDTCIILDTNPPSPRHWIAQLEEETLGNGRELLGDPAMQAQYAFWHIPTRENAHNLPPRYVETLELQYKNNPAMYKRMLLGQYAEAFDGAPVIHKFSDSTHGHDSLPWPKGAYLVRGWDFGNVNACIFSAYFMRKIKVPIAGTKQFVEKTYEYWWALSDLILEQSDTERQSRAVLKHTGAFYPFWNNRSICAGVLDYCDPAGAANTDKGRSIDVLNTYGVNVGYNASLRSLPTTLAICNRLMEARDEQNNPCFRIDRDRCNHLYVGLLGGYRYPKEGEVGYHPDKPIPLKGPSAGNYDHPVDAWRYSVINCMQLAKQKVEQKKPSHLHKKTKVNPTRYGGRASLL